MFELVESPISKLREKIDPIQFSMMTTFSAEHNLLSRPMTHQAIDTDGTLWFFTADESQVAEDLARQSVVNVSFSSPSDKVYVSMSGHAVLLKDSKKAEQLWNPMVDAWFPLGPKDPHLSLIKFSAYELNIGIQTRIKCCTCLQSQKRQLQVITPGRKAST